MSTAFDVSNFTLVGNSTKKQGTAVTRFSETLKSLFEELRASLRNIKSVLTSSEEISFRNHGVLLSIEFQAKLPGQTGFGD